MERIVKVIHYMYFFVAFCCAALFLVSCYTVPYEQGEYGGYNPPVAELAMTGGVGMVVLPYLVWGQRKRPESRVNCVATDFSVTFLLWVFLIGGVGGLINQTFNLQGCQNLLICRLFSTQMAFTWMAWIVLSIFLVAVATQVGQAWASKERIVFTRVPTSQLFVKERASQSSPNPAAVEKVDSGEFQIVSRPPSQPV